VNWWQAAELGLVQGLTEFLPVSSDGHLVLAGRLTGAVAPGVWFEVMLHLATLAAVLIVFGKRLGELALGVLRGRADDIRYVALLTVATVPAVIAALTIGDLLARTFDSLTAAGIGFLVTGAVLWSSRGRGGERAVPLWGTALLIGVAQAIAILPGVSRSGLTITTALWLGMGPVPAGTFSFLMSVPAILGAGVFELTELEAARPSVPVVPLAVGCAVALVAGIWAIRFLVQLLSRRRFHAFAPYCWAVGILTLLLAWMTP
jgi:undecaprenyl-diphosphatase